MPGECSLRPNLEDELDTFMQYRATNICKSKKKCENGTFQVKRETAGGKKLVSENLYEEALLPPAPDWLPWKEYKETVSSSVQRKLGHKRQKFNGRDGVLMPPKAGTPWKVQPKIATVTKTQQVLAEQSDDEGSDVDRMFEEIETEKNEALDNACKGASTLEDMIKAVQQEKLTEAPRVSGEGSPACVLTLWQSAFTSTPRRLNCIGIGGECGVGRVSQACPGV